MGVPFGARLSFWASVRPSAARPSVCGGQWEGCADGVCQRNGIEARDLAVAIFDALEKGGHKGRSVALVGNTTSPKYFERPKNEAAVLLFFYFLIFLQVFLKKILIAEAHYNSGIFQSAQRFFGRFATIDCRNYRIAGVNTTPGPPIQSLGALRLRARHPCIKTHSKVRSLAASLRSAHSASARGIPNRPYPIPGAVTYPFRFFLLLIFLILFFKSFFAKKY